MKYLEQRVEELELEVKLIKAKNKLEETKKPNYLFSHSDQEFLTKFGLETSIASPYDYSDKIECPLDTITVTLSSITDDTAANSNYVDSSDLPQYIPPYPDILDSWDDNYSYDGAYFSEFDTEDKNYLDYLTTCGLDKTVSNLKKTFTGLEEKIEKKFGKIISKFKILNHEWEMDGYGYIVDDNNDKKIVVTDHGRPIVVDKKYLNDIISGYKERIQETQRALFLIK
jgi:hypothetical protein